MDLRCQYLSAYLYIKNTHSLEPLLALQVHLKEAVSLQRSVCSWALDLTPWQVYSPTKGPRGESSALGGSQLGLVYFPPLSNKRHFLVLMAWKESVITIQGPWCDQTWNRATSSTEALHHVWMALGTALLWEVMIIEIFTTPCWPLCASTTATVRTPYK